MSREDTVLDRYIDRAQTDLDCRSLSGLVVHRFDGTFWDCDAGTVLDPATAKRLCGPKATRRRPYVNSLSFLLTEAGIPFTPRDYQWPFLRAQEPHRGFIGGLGTGKTALATATVVESALCNPNTRWIVAAPRKATLKDSTIPHLEAKLPSWAVLPPRVRSDVGLYGRADDSGRYKIQLKNGSQFICVTVEERTGSYNSLSGINAAGFLLDEGRFCPEAVWHALIARVRATNAHYRRYILATTPPFALNWIYDLFECAKAEDRAEYGIYKAKTSQADYLPPGYLDDLLHTLSPTMAAVMVDAEFRSGAGTVFGYEFNEDITSDSWCDWTYDSHIPVYWGFDYGFRKNVVVFYQMDSAKNLICFDEIVVLDTPIDRLAELILEKEYPLLRGWCDPQITAHTLKEFRGRLNLKPSQLMQCRTGWNIEDRVELYRARLLNAAGVRRLRFARSLHGRSYGKGIAGCWQSMSRYHYPEKEKSKATTRRPVYDHVTCHWQDAAQYPILGLDGDTARGVVAY